MTFDQQLRAIVGAVAFAAPDRVRITSRRNTQRDIVVAMQGNAFGGLTYALYTDWYSALPSDPAPATAPARARRARPNFSPACRRRTRSPIATRTAGR